jgi:hypothetical protein
MPAPSKACGQHTELSSNSAVRVTRCSCGTVHVHFLASGVTMKMSQDVFRGVSAGLKIALDREDDIRLGSTTIN